ncbi:hypothetical protein K3495_g7525 [Podosphaera aphanis]|nr:hypothetical protein K3495_g7525 [Podosphaera aphanis]
MVKCEPKEGAEDKTRTTETACLRHAPKAEILAVTSRTEYSSIPFPMPPNARTSGLNMTRASRHAESGRCGNLLRFEMRCVFKTADVALIAQGGEGVMGWEKGASKIKVAWAKSGQITERHSQSM